MLMLPHLTAAELSYSAVVLNRAHWTTWSGENRVWGLGIAINLGTLLGNASAVAEYFTAVRPWPLCVVVSDRCAAMPLHHRCRTEGKCGPLTVPRCPACCCGAAVGQHSHRARCR